MKIIITGANGYIGARLCQFLAVKSHDIIAVCHPSIPDVDYWGKYFYKIINGDIREQRIIKQIADLKADAIIHLISLDHYDSEKDTHFVSQINVLPTWNLLKECTKTGLKKFIYFSTIHVYGKLEKAIIVNENHPIKTANIYGLTHYLSENICDHYNRNSNTNVITVRLSNSYGAPIFPENNCWWLAMNDLCKSAYKNQQIKLLSDGTPLRDFIHGNDVCQAVELLINSADRPIQESIYHISSGNTHTILELAEKIRTIYKNRYDKTIPVSTSENAEVEDFTNVGNDKRYIIDNSRLRNIGFDPCWSLDKGINELFDYMEKNHGV
jgi:UDP-glucose 4-epimerase